MHCQRRPLQPPRPPSQGSAKHLRIPKLRTPRGEPLTKENSQAPPVGAGGAAKAPSGRCPQAHNNFETLGQGTGTARRSPQIGGNGDLGDLSLSLPNALSRWPRAAPAWPGLPAPPRPPRPRPPRPPAGRPDAIGPRPLPRRERAARSTHLGRAALPAGLRRAR